MKNAILVVLVFGLSILGLVSCSDPVVSPPAKSCTITGVGWYSENINVNYWTTPPSSAQTAFFDFWIHYDGNITAADIEYARVYLDANNWWTINSKTSYVDDTKKIIGGWGRWYDNDVPHTLPIGPLKVEIKLISGAIASGTVTVPAPGSATATGYATMSSEARLNPPATSAPMIRQAVATGTSGRDTVNRKVRVTFSVNDPKVNNGVIDFYDSAKHYLGSSPLFYSASTGAANASLIGSGLDKTGGANSVIVANADIAYATGHSYSEIAQAVVVLYDGGQYPLRSDGNMVFDCLSRSNFISLSDSGLSLSVTSSENVVALLPIPAEAPSYVPAWIAAAAQASAMPLPADIK